MAYFLGFLSLFLIGMVVNGLWTGSMLVKHGPDVQRNERPVLFYFWVVVYLLIAGFLARWALESGS